MGRIWVLIPLVVCFSVCTGCAMAHRYPAYRGLVLEKGTDKPIGGAGVLAYYRTNQWLAGPGGGISRYLGFQADMTDGDGKFEIPAKWFFPFRPFNSFDPSYPLISIYKEGYGNFGSGFSYYGGKVGMSKPEISHAREFPPDMDVTFWLPKLETKEEIAQHDRTFPHWMNPGDMKKDGFPPRGTRWEQYGYWGVGW